MYIDHPSYFALHPIAIVLMLVHFKKHHPAAYKDNKVRPCKSAIPTAEADKMLSRKVDVRLF